MKPNSLGYYWTRYDSNNHTKDESMSESRDSNLTNPVGKDAVASCSTIIENVNDWITNTGDSDKNSNVVEIILLLTKPIATTDSNEAQAISTSSLKHSSLSYMQYEKLPVTQALDEDFPNE